MKDRGAWGAGRAGRRERGHPRGHRGCWVLCLHRLRPGTNVGIWQQGWKRSLPWLKNKPYTNPAVFHPKTQRKVERRLLCLWGRWVPSEPRGDVRSGTHCVGSSAQPTELGRDGNEAAVKQHQVF